MPKKQDREATSLAKLTPDSIAIMVDGEELRVAGNAQENDLMNKVNACRVRALFQKTLKDYADDNLKLGPKELKDLVEAARHVATLCGEAYAKEETNSLARNVTPQAENLAADIDFSVTTKIPEVTKTQSDNPPMPAA